MAASDADDLVGKVPVKKRIGRPPVYELTDAFIDEFCARLVEGRSMRSICGDEDMPSISVVLKWLRTDASFRQQYAQAREAQADTLVEDILFIADDRSRDPNDRRVSLEARKWIAGKMKPKKYGEKILVGEDADNPLSKGGVEIDVFKLADQMREAKRLAAQEPIAIEGKKAP